MFQTHHTARNGVRLRHFFSEQDLFFSSSDTSSAHLWNQITVRMGHRLETMATVIVPMVVANTQHTKHAGYASFIGIPDRRTPVRTAPEEGNVSKVEPAKQEMRWINAPVSPLASKVGRIIGTASCCEEPDPPVIAARIATATINSTTGLISKLQKKLTIPWNPGVPCIVAPKP